MEKLQCHSLVIIKEGWIRIQWQFKNSWDKCVWKCVCLIKPNSWPNTLRYVSVHPIGSMMSRLAGPVWEGRLLYPQAHRTQRGPTHLPRPSGAGLVLSPGASPSFHLEASDLLPGRAQLWGLQSLHEVLMHSGASGSFLWSNWPLSHLTRDNCSMDTFSVNVSPRFLVSQPCPGKCTPSPC